MRHSTDRRLSRHVDRGLGCNDCADSPGPKIQGCSATKKASEKKYPWGNSAWACGVPPCSGRLPVERSHTGFWGQAYIGRHRMPMGSRTWRKNKPANQLERHNLTPKRRECRRLQVVAKPKVVRLERAWPWGRGPPRSCPEGCAFPARRQAPQKPHRPHTHPKRRAHDTQPKPRGGDARPKPWGCAAETESPARRRRPPSPSTDATHTAGSHHCGSNPAQPGYPHGPPRRTRPPFRCHHPQFAQPSRARFPACGPH